MLHLQNINAFPKLYGLLDKNVLNSIGVTRLRRIPRFDLDGVGVMVGFVDTGINYTLDIFKYDEMSTRITAIWDQTIYEGEEYTYANYGRIYRKEDINEAIVSENPFEIVKQRDDNGHGTSLAAISVGGEDFANGFEGVASNSEIIVVKLKESKEYLKEYYKIVNEAICYQDNDIMAGIQFLIDEAKKANKPLVICLGIGSSLGSHEGRDNLSQYIDDISSNSGVAICVAAGNEAVERHHYEGLMSLKEENKPETIELNVGNQVKGFTMELWIEAPNSASIGIRTPMGESTNIIQMRQNRSERIEFLFDGTKIYIDMKNIEENTGNALIVLRFFEPSQGVWNIDVYKEIKIEGKFGAWLPLNELVDKEVYFLKANPNTTLVSIANGIYSIAIGGYDYRNEGLYFNSSRGYTFDNRIKPDIVAPAVEVISPNSRGDYSTNEGTSIASAITAGAVSLLFQWAASVIYFLEFFWKIFY